MKIVKSLPRLDVQQSVTTAMSGEQQAIAADAID
jgi:hypothetical protein